MDRRLMWKNQSNVHHFWGFWGMEGRSLRIHLAYEHFGGPKQVKNRFWSSFGPPKWAYTVVNGFWTSFESQKWTYTVVKLNQKP